MRILMLSFFFEPDLSAGSFRATAMLRALAAQASADSVIDLLTTQPNRYETYRVAAPEREQRGNVTIRRFPLPAHRSGFVDQAKAFLAYARQVRRDVRDKRYDLVVVTSGRLFSSTLGAWIARTTGARLYLDIRDIFVDTMANLLPKALGFFFVPAFALAERFAIGSATRVNLVSGGFLDYFRRRYPRQSFGVIPNGIDDEFLAADFAKPPSTGKIRVLYAGNLGSGQGMERIVPGMASALADSHEFIVVGDGGQKHALAQAVAGLPNVRLQPPVSRAELTAMYREADVLFLHLNDHDAFRKVLPSKLFEYAATGKPMLAGVAGHAAEFLADVPNVGVFPPCDVVAGVHALTALRPGPADRAGFVARYSRSTLMAALAGDILATAGAVSEPK